MFTSQLTWHDVEAKMLAEKVLLCSDIVSEGQFDGRPLKNIATWESYLADNGKFPNVAYDTTRVVHCAPCYIIECFKKPDYLAGLALVVAWGGMWRTKAKIYPQWPDKGPIEHALKFCADDLVKTRSAQLAWERLTKKGDDNLSWSPVIASKCLHFLARAVGFEKNPPVPLDNAVTLGKVWPAFRKQTGQPHLSVWGDGSWAAYVRYMTTIQVWADKLNWTTTEVEATLFKHFSEKDNSHVHFFC